MIRSVKDVETLVYSSWMRIWPDIPQGSDQQTRQPYLTRNLIDQLGIQDDMMENLLVTGSKGKGSLAVILAAVLRSQGIRAGLFTSPHLQEFRERIRVDGKACPPETLLRAACRLEAPFRRLEASLSGKRYIGPVGAASALALDVFEQMGTRWNVIELGRGARYDDVNQIRARCCLVNRVFVEHAGPLGRTLEDVAFHKAGVIHPGMEAAYSARQDPVVERVLTAEADALRVPLYIGGRDFSAQNVRPGIENTVFDYWEGADLVYRDLSLGLLGRHQADNAALALFCLRQRLENMREQEMRAQLANLRWFGRLEILDKTPLTLLDGCISKDCMGAVLEIFRQAPGRPRVGVVGIPAEKDYQGVVAALQGEVDHLIVTRAANDYLKFAPEQVGKVRAIRPDALYEPEAPRAAQQARTLAGPEGAVLLVGTQSMIRDIKEYLGQSTLDVF